LDDYNTYRNGKYNYKIKMTSGMVNLLKKDWWNINFLFLYRGIRLYKITNNSNDW
jgi:hypothetical protein